MLETEVPMSLADEDDSFSGFSLIIAGNEKLVGIALGALSADLPIIYGHILRLGMTIRLNLEEKTR